ncbi:hypothetical protein [Pseudoxanthomonas sp. JBR18]|uniref:hypothetical protein n=1 Tax=Pseudoxanthomonas sp. JBR18 TaxID=2969308 RepID=UPI0023068BD3|nr:hypothetical protein [Pseudoxanthomonas sp. JBR18]WCE03878.1 hypothetical protein PJ250_17600 [Pseudoxanthomonas sp. JBR18]
MKSRHVYSTRDVQDAKACIQAALGAGVPRDDVALIANGELEVEQFPDSMIDADTDLKHGAIRGAVGGGAAGLVAGLIGVAVPPLGLTLAGAGAMALAGAAVGSWSAALVGASVPDPVRRTFEEEIESGRVLVIVDAEPPLLQVADAAVQSAGAKLLPYEQPSALS